MDTPDAVSRTGGDQTFSKRTPDVATSTNHAPVSVNLPTAETLDEGRRPENRAWGKKSQTVGGFCRCAFVSPRFLAPLLPSLLVGDPSFFFSFCLVVSALRACGGFPLFFSRVTGAVPRTGKVFQVSPLVDTAGTRWSPTWTVYGRTSHHGMQDVVGRTSSRTSSRALASRSASSTAR